MKLVSMFIISLLGHSTLVETWICSEQGSEKKRITNVPSVDEHTHCKRLTGRQKTISRVSPDLFEIYKQEALDFLEKRRGDSVRARNPIIGKQEQTTGYR